MMRAAPRRSTPSPWLACLVLAVLALPAVAQEPGSTRVDESSLPAVEAPPELGDSDRQKLGRALKKLTTKKEAARRKAEDEVIALGRGALPVLLEEAQTDHPTKQLGVYRCLVELADARDRDIVADCLHSEHVVLRRFAAHEAGQLAIERLLQPATDLVDDEDAVVRREAAISLATHGYEEALDALLAVWPGPSQEQGGGSRKSRRGSKGGDDEAQKQALRERILGALAGLAHSGDHDALAVGLTIDDAREREDPEGAAAERRATVAMLSAIGDDAAVAHISRALDDPHNLVQRDAIDALRHILEDQPAFSGGSIFAQINEVKRLKALLKQR